MVWGHWVSASLGQGWGDAGHGQLLALRKQCDTRALDLLISVGTGMGCCGVVSHRSLGRLIQEKKPFHVPPVANVGTRCVHLKAVCP